MWSRRLATTKHGFIDVMPGSARVDVVAILHGCSCPILLRSFGDEFKIVSPCYVEGIKQGESIAWASGAIESAGTRLETTDIELV